MKRSKSYKEATKDFDSSKFYSVEDAIVKAKELSYSKFVGSLDVIINLNVPAKHKNTSIRGSITLPYQKAESVTKVIVIAEGNDIKTAEDAGADEAGGDELLKKIEGGYTDFDVLIATPSIMPKLAKLGRVLGPKGLMPNPKNETVTVDIERVVSSYKAGKMDYKINEQGAVKAKIGKLDQSNEELMENFMVFFQAITNETKILGPNRLKSIYLGPTMGPSIKIDKTDLLKESE